MYCWRTKKGVVSMGFVPVAESLSVMLMVADEFGPRLAPVGLLKETVKVSVPSDQTSSTTGMKMVEVLSPAAKRSVPVVVA